MVAVEVVPVVKVFNQLYAGVADVKVYPVAADASYVDKACLVLPTTSTHS